MALAFWQASLHTVRDVPCPPLRDAPSPSGDERDEWWGSGSAGSGSSPRTPPPKRRSSVASAVAASASALSISAWSDSVLRFSPIEVFAFIFVPSSATTPTLTSPTSWRTKCDHLSTQFLQAFKTPVHEVTPSPLHRDRRVMRIQRCCRGSARWSHRRRLRKSVSEVLRG